MQKKKKASILQLYFLKAFQSSGKNGKIGHIVLQSLCLVKTRKGKKGSRQESGKASILLMIESKNP